MDIDVLRRSIYQTLIEGRKTNNIAYIEELGFNIPKDWDVAKLSEVAELNIGNTTNKIIKDQFEGNKEGLPYIATKNVLFDRTIDVDRAMVLPLNFSKFKISSPGSILFCKEGGSFGRKISIVDQECYFGNKLININSKSIDNKLVNKYLYYVLQSTYFFNEVNSRKTGIISGINKEQLGSIYVPVPTEKEMKSIVILLEKVENKINELEENYLSINRLIDSYEELLLPSLYQYALQGKLTNNISGVDYGVDVESSIIREGDKYFEVINGEKVDITSDILFEVPSNYKWFRLGDIIESNSGLTFKPHNKTNALDGIPVLRSNNIKDRKINLNDVIYVNMDIPKSKILNKGDILMCNSNGSAILVGKTAIVEEKGYSFGSFMSKIKSAVNDYLFIYFNSPQFRNDISGDVQTVTINRISKQLLNNLMIALPPLEEQVKIIKKIREIETIIHEK